MTSSYFISTGTSTLVYSNGRLAPLNISYTNMSTRRKISYKIGRLAGRAKRFFTKRQTKVAAIVTYWGVETALFALIILSAPTLTIAAAGLFLYLYGSYALFSAANAMIG